MIKPCEAKGCPKLAVNDTPMDNQPHMFTVGEMLRQMYCEAHAQEKLDSGEYNPMHVPIQVKQLTTSSYDEQPSSEHP